MNVRLVIFGLLALTEVVAPKAQAAWLLGLGDLPGDDFWSEASDISADGKIVVGKSRAFSGFEAFRWTASTGIQGLGHFSEGFGYSVASSISADGSTIVGVSDAEPFRWTSSQGMHRLTGLEGPSWSVASGVSADGSVVTGSFRPYGAGYSEAFRWSTDTGLQRLGTLDGDYESFGSGISADGTTIVGGTIGIVDSSSRFQGFRWTASTGIQGLGDLGFSLDGQAYDVSADGTAIVGVANLVEDPEAFRWTEAGGMQGLGFVRGDPRLGWPNSASSRATAVSADGSVVVGTSYFPSEDLLEVFVWDQNNGMRSLFELLAADGVDLSGWSGLSAVGGVSADGLTIAGTGTRLGRTEAFIARLGPTPVPAPAAAWLFGSALVGLVGVRRARG